MDEMLKFDADVLMKEIDGLPLWKRAAFFLGLCERLAPNYELFAADTGGDRKFLRTVLDIAWSLVETNSFGVNTENTVTDCERVAPDTEEFEHILVSAALDAVSATCLLFEYISSPDTKLIVQAAGLARDSIDLYVQVSESIQPSDPQLEVKILMHPLMQGELARQHDDIVRLRSYPSDDLSVLGGVRKVTLRPYHLPIAVITGDAYTAGCQRCGSSSAMRRLG